MAGSQAKEITICRWETKRLQMVDLQWQHTCQNVPVGLPFFPGTLKQNNLGKTQTPVAIEQNALFCQLF